MQARARMLWLLERGKMDLPPLKSYERIRMSNTLNPAETVALAGCVKDTALKAAKNSLPEASAENVDFQVRIHGSVQKGVGTASTVSVEPARVSLTSRKFFCAVLRTLGIGPKRLKTAVESTPPDEELKDDADMVKVFEYVERDRAAALPAVEKTVPGRAGAVSSQVSASKL
jgi:hypothetical protein